jgi:hypothetical protein
LEKHFGNSTKIASIAGNSERKERKKFFSSPFFRYANKTRQQSVCGTLLMPENFKTH